LYIRHLNQATRQSVRVLELSRRVLGHAAAGELPLPTVARTLQNPAQRHGYASRSAAIYARFLAGLAALAAGQPASADPPAPDLAADPTAWFDGLAQEAARLHAARLKVDLRTATGGRPDPAALDFQGLIASLVRLQADLQAAVHALLLQGAENCLQALVDAIDATAPGPATIRIRGVRGERAETVIAIENGSNASAAVRCRVTDVRRPDGIGPAFDPDAAFDPELAVIPPGDEARVRVSIVLDDRLDPGVVYEGAVRIVRHDGPELRLPLEIHVEVPAMGAPAIGGLA
jgi:hypothetical protein